MERLFQDLRYAIRLLLKQPGFTAVAVIALALGIGANTAIFSVVNAVLLRPLPFPEPQQLVNIWETNPQRGQLRGAVSYPNFADWRDQNQVFEKMSSYHEGDFVLTGMDEPVRLTGQVVNADLFPLLGVSPVLGRYFLTEEDQPGDAGRVVILSYRLWKGRFNSDPEIINRSLVLNGKNYNVVGVMPDGFQFPIQNQPSDLWATVSIDSTGKEPITSFRGAHY